MHTHLPKPHDPFLDLVPGGFGERQSVAFIHQDLGLIEWMTVAENIALALGFKKKSGLIQWGDVDRFAAEALRRVECDFDPTTRVENLSRTEKSLVAIARALANDPRLVIADEPTGNLDPATTERVFATLIKMVREEGAGVLVATHNLALTRHMDRVLTLKDGKLVDYTA